MRVSRVKDERGSYIDPPLEQRWSDRKKLDWLAAVIKNDYGLDVSVYDAKAATKVSGIWGPDRTRKYGISFSWVSCGPYSFDEAWIVMNALGMGYKAGRRS